MSQNSHFPTTQDDDDDEDDYDDDFDGYDYAADPPQFRHDNDGCAEVFTAPVETA